MSPITTHVLDTAKGIPASGIKASLELLSPAGPILIAEGTTDQDGRIMLWSYEQFDQHHQTGHYQITFEIDSYHQGLGFFPQVVIPFRVTDTDAHYHVPLLLSPFSYSTYRGS